MTTATEVHYETGFLTVSWNDELAAVEMDWHDFAKGEQFRGGLDEGLALVREQGAENWLADLRDLGTVDQADQEWSNEEWFPRAIDAGLKNMAIVKPESAIAEMSVDAIMQEVEGTGLVTHYFDNRADAEAWLREQ
jgi:hypothetical protein